MSQAFAADEVRAVYRAIRERRDMRHFAGGQVAPGLLRRLLEAAHHAPSVGFMHRGVSSAFAMLRCASVCTMGSSANAC